MHKKEIWFISHFVCRVGLFAAGLFFVLQWWLLCLRCPSVVASPSSLSFSGGFSVFAVLQYLLLYLLHVCEVFLHARLLEDIVGHCTWHAETAVWNLL
jgi:hypothetical protein